MLLQATMYDQIWPEVIGPIRIVTQDLATWEIHSGSANETVSCVTAGEHVCIYVPTGLV